MSEKGQIKNSIKEFWNKTPCGLRNRGYFGVGTFESFELIREDRYQGDNFMLNMIPWQELGGLQTLEVGCGLGTDLIRFVHSGARAFAIDFSSYSLELAQKNLKVHNLSASLVVADAESLPYRDHSFDFVYSWGCLHHTADPEKAIHEIYRVLKPAGKFLIMLYHKFSLVSLQAYLLYGLFRGRPLTKLDDILARHIESPGTKAYSIQKVRKLFGHFTQVTIKPVVTRYDLRYGRTRYLPSWVRKLVPPVLGWNLIIRGSKSE